MSKETHMLPGAGTRAHTHTHLARLWQTQILISEFRRLCNLVEALRLSLQVWGEITFSYVS